MALAGRFNDHHALLARRSWTASTTPTSMIDGFDDADRASSWPRSHRRLTSVASRSRGSVSGPPRSDLARSGSTCRASPPPAHLASWAGLCPGNNESAGKHRSGRTRHGSKWLRKALIEAGQAAGRDQEHLPRRPIRPDPLPPRTAARRRRRRPLDPRDRLAPALHRRALQRPRRRLLRPAPQQHRPPTPTRRPTRSHGPPRHPRTSSLTKPHHRGSAPNGGYAPAPPRAQLPSRTA